MVSSEPRHGAASTRLHEDLAEWYPLLTPVEDYVEEAAIDTAFSQTAPGRVALFQPDSFAETFAEGTGTGGSDAAGFEARVVPLEHSVASGYDVFVGRRPGR